MHLIGYGRKLRHPSFYQKRRPLTRVDSLPYIFRKLRIHRNLTKRALAKKFCVSEEYLSQIEDGSKFPSLNFCLKCAGEFGINPNYVKSKWAEDTIERFSNRLMKRLKLEN